MALLFTKSRLCCDGFFSWNLFFYHIPQNIFIYCQSADGQISVFENLTGIAERILQKTDVSMTDTMFEEIKYDVVDEKLERERERSQRWLDNALSKEGRV